MLEKKMATNEFITQLREKAQKSNLLDKVYFVITGQRTDEYGYENISIVMVSSTANKVLCGFNYENNGLIYNLVFGSISFAELVELTNIIKSILDDYNF